ncbi:peptidylprolyl isomerase [Vibrio zhugei]|uniref:Periplasmic chaperone PpiD n=1 Tax=Vibrio zhugei TaxID=2479546 RepID=A0ABV7CAP7_9VIBR|nr:peptidylprolyl isomerase [Vibrio zhugei]
MMDRLREGANSIAIKVILGLIILSFVFAGIGSYLVSGSNNAAAKVGDTTISRAKFEQAYQNERNRMQSQMGDYFSNLLGDPSYVASFRKSVLDRMINDALIEQYAKELGLRVSDKQVREQLLQIPAFQKDGQFDKSVYQAALQRSQFTPDTFAEYLRQDMLRNQLMQAIQSSEFTLPDEVKQQAALIGQTRSIRTITLDTADFAKKISLKDDEIKQYYQEHPQAFTRPEQEKVSYLELSANALKEGITISDDAAKQYYDEHKSQYSTPEQRDVSHILIKGDEQQAQAILKELHNGAKFSVLAKKESQDVGSAKQGGELGWIERKTMDPKFEDAAFALKKAGDISGVVKSSFGYHIIKLNGIKAPKAKPFSEVKDKIVADLKDQKAVDKFYTLQDKLEKVAFESPDSLDAAAKAIGVQYKTTDFIGMNGQGPELLQNQDVQKALDSEDVKDEGLNSKVIQLGPEDVAVVRVEQTRPEKLLPLEEVKSDVVKTLTTMKAEDQANTLADKVIDALNKGDQSILKANDLAFSSEKTIDRNSALASTVFSMAKPQKGKVSYERAQDEKNNTIIVALDSVATKSDAKLNEQLEQQLPRLLLKQDIQGILSVLRANTDIEYYVK